MQISHGLRPSAPSGSSNRAVMDLEVAERWRDRVKGAPEAPRVWPKVNSLLEDFREHHLTDEIADRIAASLEAAGLRLDPPLRGLPRSSTVCLSLPDPDSEPAIAREFLAVTDWVRGEEPTPLGWDDRHRGN